MPFSALFWGTRLNVAVTHATETQAQGDVVDQQVLQHLVGLPPATAFHERFRHVLGAAAFGLGIGIEDNGCAHDEHAKLAFSIGRRDTHLEALAVHPHIFHP